MEVECKLKVYDQGLDKKSSVLVKSHWSQRNMVKITIDVDGDALQTTVVGAELIEAIRNAMNKGVV